MTGAPPVTLAAASATLRAGVVCAVLAAAPLLLSRPASAQGGVISGAVADSLTSAPLPGAHIRALAADGSIRGETLSNGSGRFRLPVPDAGPYALEVDRIGYEPWRLEGIRAVIGEAPGGRAVSVRLRALPVLMEEIVITPSRSPESALDAPAAVSVVDRERIEQSVSFTPLDEIRATPGMDFATKGLMQHTFAVRGGRSANSAAVLLLADHRYARLPSIGFNVPYLMPSSSEDVERIEVTRGPGAALYGPNSYQGVVHLITRSPFESTGTTVSVAGGERYIRQGSLRTAARLNERLAFKLSGEYFRGRDWPFADSAEVANRDSALAHGADPETLRIGKRERRAERASGEARLDWHPDPETEVVATGGLADALATVDLVPDIGSVQVRDWRYGYGQIRVSRGRLFANALLDLSDAGESYQLRTGAPLVDHSRAAALQLQHGTVLAGRHRLLYGVDVQLTDPRTDGTINGRNENDDRVIETGAYLQETAVVGPRIDLIGALRADHHDRLADVAVSPRAALVFRPAPSHALRLTYNRAFNSPDASDLFVDIVADSLPVPFAVRRVGTPLEGFSVDRSCGGLCMRSPFTPVGRGGPAAALPADATLLWSEAFVILDSLGVQLPPIPAPQPGQVATDLRALEPAGEVFVPVLPEDLSRIAPPRRTITNAFELGYKGIVRERLLLEVDVYHHRLSQLLGGLFSATPNVFLDQESLAAYLGMFLPLESAARVAAVAAGIPLGTVTSAELASPDILVMRRQGGDASFWGADAAVAADLTPELSAAVSFSWVSDDSIPGVSGLGAFVLGAPVRKGTLSVAWRDREQGLSARIEGRAVASFPVESGVYQGRVPGYEVVDLYAGWRLPWAPTLELSLEIQNLLDDRHREYVGAPRIGRLAVGRVRARL